MKIHLIWGVVTVVAAAAWGQHVARSREIEFRERERILQVKIVQATAIAAAAPATSMLPPSAPTSPARAENAAVDANPKREYEVQSDVLPTVEELRRLARDDGWRAYQVIQRMVKSPLRTDLLQELFRNKEPQVRRAALSLLQQDLGPEAAAPMLQHCLRSDADAVVRMEAARLLGQQDVPGSIEALLQAFQKDEPEVQIHCAAALSSLGQPGPASQLIPRFAGMLDNPDGAVRRDAVESMNRLTSPQVLPLLTRALRDTNGDVRLEALSGMWDFMETMPIASLVEPLLNDPVAAVRAAAKEFLDQANRKKE